MQAGTVIFTGTETASRSFIFSVLEELYYEKEDDKIHPIFLMLSSSVSGVVQDKPAVIQVRKLSDTTEPMFD